MGHNNFKPRDYPLPTLEEAHEFAVMLTSGMPPGHAIQYFTTIDAPAELIVLAELWSRSKEVQAAILKLQKKPWQDMGLEEKIKFSIDKHYTEMAYFLYSTNYSMLNGADRQKSDTCRQSLEAKLAGMAGKMDALSRFWDDVVEGKVALSSPPVSAVPS